MIEITPDTGCMLYVGGLLFLLFVIWWKTSQKSKKREVVTITKQKSTCEYCGNSYIAESRIALHRCPHCSCINEMKEKS